jgi:hypothetical protein
VSTIMAAVSNVFIEGSFRSSRFRGRHYDVTEVVSVRGERAIPILAATRPILSAILAARGIS